MLPFVSVCTPTYNRRPFINMMKQCFLSQTYPHTLLEWIIVDDGTDKVGDLLQDIPQIKYFHYDQKMPLGAKRNLMHQKTKGQIIVYMDDDDFYPPERIQHAVETLIANPTAMCAGSSIMYLYFKHVSKMYKFGPYGPNHATAATFAFWKKLLDSSHYEDTACLAEEKHFLKDYTVPFVQLDPMKTILVFSHIHNTFDKKKLLDQQSPFVCESTISVTQFIKDQSIRQFFMEDIDTILQYYEPGDIKNKPDVLKQIESISAKRKEMEEEMKQKKLEAILSKHPLELANDYEKHIMEINRVQHLLKMENQQLKEKIAYLEKTMADLIKKQIAYRTTHKTS
jgi:glycosyltransferase involved in cell wall biosynthesis